MTSTDFIVTASEDSSKTIEQLYAVVHRYCLALTGSGWDAEDLTQDTWLKATATLQSRGHANPEAYLLRIAKTTWTDQLRRKHRWAQIMQQQQAVLIPAGKEELSLELEETLYALLKHFTPVQRAVWLLRDVWDFTNKETAELLQMTEGAVKSALHRARQLLQSVRDELESGSPIPAELHPRLAALSAAIRSGNITALLQLIQIDSPIRRRSQRITGTPTMLLAA